MLHTAKISVRPNNIRPFHIECSCSTAGDFDSEPEARSWMENRHFANLAGVDESGEIALVPTPVFLAKHEPVQDVTVPDVVDQFHKAVAEFVSASAPTPSAPAPVSPPESGEEVKSETVGDA